MEKDWVVHQMQDANNNPICWFNQNPNLGMCLYEVKFAGGEVTELQLTSL